MKVLSTNVGVPKEFTFNGQTLMSSMRRTAVPEGIQVTFGQVTGDQFAGPTVHGIKEAVVYAYSAAVFPKLSELFTQTVGAGNVGENLTLDDIREDEIIVGDEYEVGDVRLRASGPRYPCSRLNFCFQRPDALMKFRTFARPGVYFEVVKEGRVRTGDTLRHVKSNGGKVSVAQLYDGLCRRAEKSADAAEAIAGIGADPMVPTLFKKRLGIELT